MNNSNLEPKIQSRTTPFYGKYLYCLRGYQNEFFTLRNLRHDRIDAITASRREWGKRMNLRQPGSWYWSNLEISDQDVENLHAMCDFLLAEQRDHKLVIAGSWFYVYTNDMALVTDMGSLPWLDRDKLQITQAQLRGQPGTIQLKKARYRMRSYLRSILLDDGRRNNLTQLLKQQKTIRLSPSLQHFVDANRWTRTYDYHFIDHDDTSLLTLIALVEPRLIRRTLPIVETK